MVLVGHRQDHVHATGSLDGRGYQVVGHVRYDHGRGAWDEWYLQMDDGGVAWLSEDERKLSLDIPGAIVGTAGVTALIGMGSSPGVTNLLARFASEMLLATTEAAVLATHMGQVALVVEANRTPQDAVSHSIHQLEGCANVSLILNKTSGRGGPGYGYGYGYAQGRRRPAEALGENCLADGVVDLVRTRMSQVLTLQPDLRAPLFAQSDSPGEGSRASDPVL